MAVTFDAAVSGSIGVSFTDEQPVTGRAGDGPGERDGRQDADELGGHRGREPGGRGGAGAGRRDGWCRHARSDGGQAGQGMPPGGDALAGQHAEPERERLGARVQRGMTQLLVAGVQPAAGSATWPASGRFSGSAAAWPGEGEQGQGRVLLLPHLAGGQVSGF